MNALERFVSGAVTALGFGIAAASAHAGDCSAQTGKTILEDAFKDDSGGFVLDEQARFGAPGLQMTLGKTEDNWAYVNEKFTATNGDYCVVATMPPPVADDNLAAVGITLFYVDDSNMIAIYAYSDNTVQIERRYKGDSDLILNEENPDIKASVGSTVSVRAIVQDGTITTFVNGVAFKKITVNAPPDADRFGLYVSLDRAANEQVPFDFKSFRVTSLAESKK